MADQNFSMKAGNSKTLSVPITNDAGSSIDVSGAASIVWTLAESRYSEPLLEKTLADGVSVVTSTVSVDLAPEDTAGLDGLFYHQLQITDGSGGESTVLVGVVSIAAVQVIA